MFASPKVSIAMPVHNGGRYFEQALQSALNQTYQNIEIVVVNDGSTDEGETRDVARSYQSRSDRIVYVEQPNGGVASALNTALEHMTGEIFSWLSHDDLFEPHKTEVQVDFYKRAAGFGHRLPMLFSDWTVIDAEGQTLHDAVHDHQHFVAAPMRALLTGGINGCTLFIPINLIREAGGFEPQYRYSQDYRLWNKLIRHNDFFHIPQKLVRYRHHPNQDSLKPTALKEGDPLWIDMMADRSEIERVQMFGSSLCFFRFMATHLQGTPYRFAEEYARDRAASCVGDTTVSIIVPFKANENIEPTLAALYAQTHLLIEIIAIEYGGERNHHARKRGNILYIDSTSGYYSDAVLGGLRVATGSYIVIASLDGQDVDRRIAQQLQRLMVAGKLVAYSSYVSGGIPRQAKNEAQFLAAVMAGEGYPLHCMMFHRSLIWCDFATPSGQVPGDEAGIVACLAKSGSLAAEHDALTVFRQ